MSNADLVDALAAWSKHAARDFSLRVYPGGHFYLLQRREELMRLVSGTLAA
jgi:surfactin synthase thioesterase subunit